MNVIVSRTNEFENNRGGVNACNIEDKGEQTTVRQIEIFRTNDRFNSTGSKW